MHSPDVHAAIARLTFDYARGIDDRDWATFRSVLADTCEVDFHSWSGTPPTTMDSDVWVQAVRSVTGAFDATQHLMTNHRLDTAFAAPSDPFGPTSAGPSGGTSGGPSGGPSGGQSSEGFTGFPAPVARREIVGTHEVQAQHWFDGDTMASFDRPAEPAWCALGGRYTNRYVLTDDGWRIAACRFTLRWRTGDETLFALARQRR